MSEKVRKAIEKANLKFAEAARKGDAAAVAALYTKDAVLLPPNSEMIRGRPGIKEFWGAFMQMGAIDGVLTTVELSGSGDTVNEIGKYVVVWKRTADGWKMHWDIWNSSMPPQQ